LPPLKEPLEIVITDMRYHPTARAS